MESCQNMCVLWLLTIKYEILPEVTSHNLKVGESVVFCSALRVRDTTKS